MTSSMFVVCWVLIHQPVAGQENCTPPLHYYSAQAVMDHVLRAGDVLKISMSLGPGSAPVAPQVYGGAFQRSLSESTKALTEITASSNELRDALAKSDSTAFILNEFKGIAEGIRTSVEEIGKSSKAEEK